MYNLLVLGSPSDLTDEGVKCFSAIDILNSSVGIFNMSVVNITQTGHSIKNISDRIQNAPLPKIDAVLNFFQPDKFVKHDCRTIGVFEPSCKGPVQNAQNLNLLDCCICFSNAQKEILEAATDIKEIFVMKPFVYGALIRDMASKMPTHKSINDKLIFYIPPNITNSNDLKLVFRAFLSTFDINDKVALGVYADDSQQIIDLASEVKKELSRFVIDYYPEIMIFTGVEDTHIQGHVLIDCSGSFVTNLHTMIGLGIGNHAVVMRNNPMLEWASQKIVTCDSNKRTTFVQGQRNYIQTMCEKNLSEVMRKLFQEKIAVISNTGAISSDEGLAYSGQDQQRLREFLVCS